MTRSLASVTGAAIAAPFVLLLAAAAPEGQRGVPGADVPPGGPAVHLDRLKIAGGFQIAVYADKVDGARQMALAPDGTLFVGTQQRGSVYAVVDANKDGRADNVLTIATGLNTPNGVAFRDGSLYVAEINRVLRFDKILDVVRSKGTAGAPVVVNDTLPTDRPHGWKYIAFGPDGLLYVPVGAPCNICERPDPYASILRMKPDGTGLEVFARGVRNTVGFTWHPTTGEMWFTDNGRDGLGDDVPNDELNHAPKAGLHFGFPYCHEGRLPDPEFGKDKACSAYTPPAGRLGPHVAGLGLAFYTGAAFPASYRNQLFIVNHGSWNRSGQVSHTGYRVMLARLQGNTVTSYEPFIEGWLQQGAGATVAREAWGRPVDVIVAADGSLLISDDRANVIYRVTHKP
jgi:glucose/arabinose dehydrogenase